MSIRILLADDHKIIRDGLRSLLEGQPNKGFPYNTCLKNASPGDHNPRRGLCVITAKVRCS